MGTFILERTKAMPDRLWFKNDELIAQTSAIMNIPPLLDAQLQLIIERTVRAPAELQNCIGINVQYIA